MALTDSYTSIDSAYSIGRCEAVMMILLYALRLCVRYIRPDTLTCIGKDRGLRDAWYPVNAKAVFKTNDI